jgi:hypothetical protein
MSRKRELLRICACISLAAKLSSTLTKKNTRIFLLCNVNKEEGRSVCACSWLFRAFVPAIGGSGRLPGFYFFYFMFLFYCILYAWALGGYFVLNFGNLARLLAHLCGLGFRVQGIG